MGFGGALQKVAGAQRGAASAVGQQQPQLDIEALARRLTGQPVQPPQLMDPFARRAAMMQAGLGMMGPQFAGFQPHIQSLFQMLQQRHLNPQVPPNTPMQLPQQMAQQQLQQPGVQIPGFPQLGRTIGQGPPMHDPASQALGFGMFGR